MTRQLESDEELVLLTGCDDTSEASLVRGLLEAHGIPALIQGEHTHALHGVLTDNDEVRILVRRKHLSEAQELLDATIVTDEEDEDEEEPAPEPVLSKWVRRAWLILPLVPLLLILSLVPREMRLRPHRETHEEQLAAGDTAYEAKQFQAAEAAYRQALGAAEQLPEEEGHRPDAQTRLALALMAQERWSDAEPLLRAALAEHSRQDEQETSRSFTEPPAFADDHAYLGEVLYKMKQYGEAETHLRTALSAYRGRFATSKELPTVLQLSALLLEWERPVLAVSALKATLGHLSVKMDESPERYRLLETLALAHQRAGQHEEAVRISQRALELGKRLHGETHPELFDLRETYAGSLRALGREVPETTEAAR
jgi:tetratricopeptide (TPR) repeat protein